MPQASGPQPDTAGNRKTATRADLLNAVYASCPMLSRAKAKEIFEMALEEISNSLVRGEPVKLRSFGLFLVRTKRERIGRNPRTGVGSADQAAPRSHFQTVASPLRIDQWHGGRRRAGRQRSQLKHGLTQASCLNRNWRARPMVLCAIRGRISVKSATNKGQNISPL